MSVSGMLGLLIETTYDTSVSLNAVIWRIIDIPPRPPSSASGFECICSKDYQKYSK